MVMLRAKFSRALFCTATVTSLVILSGCNLPSYSEEALSHLYGKSGSSVPASTSLELKTAQGAQPWAGSSGSAGLKDEKGKPGIKPVVTVPEPHHPDHDSGHDKDIPKQAGEPYPHPNPGPHQSPGPHPEPDPDGGYATAGTAVGESCAGSGICLGLKYVVYQEPMGDPIESDRDAADNVREVNELWRDCGIQFQIDRYVPIAPQDMRLRYRTANHTELNDIRRKFMDEQTLLVVTTGTWDRRGTLGNTWANAWTNLPGEGVYGSILERTVSRNSNVLAHELGHYLSLGHVSDPSALMNPLIYHGSTRLTPKQCQAARWAAGYFWKNMVRSPQESLR